MNRPVPDIIPELAEACARGWIEGDRGIVEARRAELMRGLVLLVVRNPIPGKYNDAFLLVLNGKVIACEWGNADPGRFGWRDAIKKYYPRVRQGLIGGMIPGPHNGIPNRMRQATAKQAAACGMRSVFVTGDPRGDGLFTVERMLDADTIARVEVGMYNINWHPGASATRTGSAGCLTNPPGRVYDSLRDLVYATGQPWLPIIITHGPIA